VPSSSSTKAAIIPLAMDLSFPKFFVRAEPGQRDRVMADAEGRFFFAAL
jgi:hypothetical protein